VAYHRDDLPIDVKALKLRQLPAVIFRMNDGVRVAMDRRAIDACGGSAEKLTKALLSRMAIAENDEL
jgi:hypothetical protein